jgi:hypothetical protein
MWSEKETGRERKKELFGKEKEKKKKKKGFFFFFFFFFNIYITHGSSKI